MPLSTITERPAAVRDAPGVPWFTVLSLAVVMAYADGFWVTSLRSAVGAIERTQDPFASWLRESTLLLPVFAFAVLAALTLARRWFGPAPLRPRTVVATALVVVAAGTAVGIVELAASSAYDYHLQLGLTQMMDSMRNACAGGSCSGQEQASFALQFRAVVYGAGILLVTNLVVVGWVVAFRGGRLHTSTPRRPDQSVLRTRVAASLRRGTGAVPALATAADDTIHGNRFEDLKLLLAAGLLGSATIHAAVVPDHLSELGTAGGAFFIFLAATELAVAAVLFGRRQPVALVAAAGVSFAPMALWLYSRTAGLPFGPEPGVPESVGLSDSAVGVLELGTFLLAIVLIRSAGRLKARPPSSAHAGWLALLAVVAIAAIGLAGSGLPIFDGFAGARDQIVMNPPR